MTARFTPRRADRDPPKDCGLCPRLAAFREGNRATFPDWYNGAVPAFGVADPRLLVVGLAPGLKGANRTGRPFTGDYAGASPVGAMAPIPAMAWRSSIP